ncbi:MAG TPA: hypothetical protein VNH84_15685, partial [Candidatus Saccharimonadales bacterium]|nr:hypothetical protein [Candidatus Saccharimonadales bacterium]
MLAILTGLLAGGVHVLSGPDHLAAVAPLAVQDRSAWRSGLRWGLGHSSGVLLVGVLSLLLRGLLPLDTVSSLAERLVGIVLVGIGIWGFRLACGNRLHSHLHAHGHTSHVHMHVHAGPLGHTHGEAGAGGHHRAGHGHSHAALLVGTLHGVAGTSHFLGVLPALAFPHWSQTLAYLVAFGVGTVGSMVAFASAIGWI